jgi:ferredoxin-type protein NapF
VSSDLSRRQFLRGDIARRRIVLRPPWARAEDEFLALCNRCGECLVSCPTGVLVAGDGGYPRINFQRGECTFCGNCAQYCTAGAIQRAGQSPWKLKAAIGGDCLAHHGVVCQVCGDQCPSHAVRFVAQPNTIAVPQLDASACQGCGACVASCPAQAITVTEIP